MTYLNRDFSGRQIRNREGVTIPSYWKKAYTAGLVGAFLVGAALARDTTPEREVKWYKVTLPGTVVYDCFDFEDSSRGGWSWNRYLAEVKAKNNMGPNPSYEVKNMLLPDTDGNGRECGVKVPQKQTVRKE